MTNYCLDHGFYHENDCLKCITKHINSLEDRLAKAEKVARQAADFIRDEYQAANDDGDLIPDVKARRIFESLAEIFQ